MLIASVAGQRASFTSGRFVQSMYQDNTLVKCQIELVGYDENAPSNLTWQQGQSETILQLLHVALRHTIDKKDIFQVLSVIQCG